MKEIGGYFGLECGCADQYHADGILLNSARNALRYIIRAYNIKVLHVPYYTCPVVWQAITSENCQIMPYDLDNNFMPTADFNQNDFILYNNYFGVCGNNVKQLAAKYPNLIVDNAQSFYSTPEGIGSFYSPRKFFGLPDGGIALCSKKLNENFEQSLSHDLCSHLLKRWELTASEGYPDFQKNDEALIDQPVQKMSKLTQALMENIDYERVKKIRLKNFEFLDKNLKKKNLLQIDLFKGDIPMVYPFQTKNIQLRQHLIQNKIYVAKYWQKEANCVCMSSPKAQEMASSILPLPIDQRYDLNDMKHILEVLSNA